MNLLVVKNKNSLFLCVMRNLKQFCSVNSLPLPQLHPETLHLCQPDEETKASY